MRLLPPLAMLCLASACSMPDGGPEPSLAPRAAEGIDPRIPVTSAEPARPVDPALAAQLQALVTRATAAQDDFNRVEAEASRLATNAGALSSDSWIIAQQGLSRLIEQHGVTTGAAADIDELASAKLRAGTLSPGDQQAVAGSAAAVAAISEPQATAIERIRERLER
jgi:hypothetical protein